MRTTMSLSNSTGVQLASPPLQNGMTGTNEVKGQVIKCGHLRKLKTMKKKYFVLRSEAENYPPRLEYYDTEKKWKVGQEPKKCIFLRLCFDINRKADRKQKHVIGLYTKDDCFAFAVDTEQELQEWLAALLSAQQGELPTPLSTGEVPKPNFEHIWQVIVKNKGLGSSKNILGNYRLCLTSNVLSLVKMTQEETPLVLDFPLGSIRCCGHSDCFFYMEVGRSSIIGSGELWMETEDTVIAKNMHEVILNAMRNIPKDEQLLHPRSRTSSTSDSGKPISMMPRRQTSLVPPHSLPTPFPPSPRIVPAATTRGYSHRRHSVSGATTSMNSRDRSDSMPTRIRTISEGPPTTVHSSVMNSRMHPNMGMGSNRPHSMYSRTISCSPPFGPTSVSPCSAAYSTDSNCSSLSMDEVDGGFLTSPDGMMENAILEETPDDYVPWEGSTTTDTSAYVPMDRSPSLHLPLNHNNNKISPSQINYGSPYMDMLSPGSPMDTPNTSAYIPMSPGTTISHSPSSGGSDSLLRAAIYLNHSRDSLGGGGQRTPHPSSANHSRTSSFADEGGDGYVPMAPAESSYMDLDVTMRRHNDIEFGSSPASSCSLPSGTPSSEHKMCEYQLDKVASYVVDDATNNLDRPISIGTKPINVIKKNRLEASGENFRVRAFSLGSRTGPKSKSTSVQASSSVTSRPKSSQPVPMTNKQNKKSSSTPVLTGTSPLSTSWSGSTAGTYFKQFLTAKIAGTGSNSDFVEMDFSKNRNSSSASLGSENGKKKSKSSLVRTLRLDSFRRKKAETCSDEYLSLQPRQQSEEYLFMGVPQPTTPEVKPWSNHVDSSETKKDIFKGYIDMTGGTNGPKTVTLQSPESEEYMLLDGGVFPSPSVDLQSPGDYMTMTPLSATPRNVPTSQPIKIQVPTTTEQQPDDYMNMNMGGSKKSSPHSRKITPSSSPFSSLRRQKSNGRKTSTGSRRNSTEGILNARTKSISQTSLQDSSLQDIPEKHAVPQPVVITSHKPPVVVPSWPQEQSASTSSSTSKASGDYMNMGFNSKKNMPPVKPPMHVVDHETTKPPISAASTPVKTELPKKTSNLSLDLSKVTVTSGEPPKAETKPVTTKTTPTKIRESKFSSAVKYSLGRSTSTGMVGSNSASVKTNLNRQWSVPSVPEPKDPKDKERKGSSGETRTLQKRASVTSLDLSRERVSQKIRSRHVSSGTRLESVTRERRSSGESSASSRPNSINSFEERELNYASLELAPPSSESDNSSVGPKSPKEVTPQGSGLTYAQIDFARSEGLRNTPHSVLHDPRI